jgi:predicted small metal-binding protein
MAKSIRCECGFVARGESDERVIGVIRDHMATDHPALLNTVSREDLLGWIQVELPHLVRKALISSGSAPSFDSIPNNGDARSRLTIISSYHKLFINMVPLFAAE